MNINTIKKLFREIKGSVPDNKTTYKTLDGIEMVRHDLSFSKQALYGFRSMTIHYVLVRSTGRRVLKKITKIVFKDGDPESIAALCARLNLAGLIPRGNKNIFKEAFESYFSHADENVKVCGGILNQTGRSEISCCFRNLSIKGAGLVTINNLAEEELMNKMKLNHFSDEQYIMKEIVEQTQLMKESHEKGKHYLLYNYLPALPGKGKGFHSISQTQDITYVKLLETLDFFFGPKGHSWKPNNEGAVKEIHEYKGKHTVYWTHAVRKLFSPEMICFAGTSLRPKTRPVVECEILYEMA